MPLTLVSALRGRPGHVPAGFPGEESTQDEGTPPVEVAGGPGLGPVAARSAAVLRLAWCVVTPVVVYGAGPVAAPSYWRELLVLGALGWGLIAAAVCWRGQLPAWLVLGDVAVCSGLLLAMVRLLPTEFAGAAGSWVLGWAGISLLLAAWRLRASVVWLVAVIEVGAYLAGSRLAGGHAGSTEPWGLARPVAGTAQAVGLLLALAAIGLVLARLVRLGAGNAEATLRMRTAAAHRDEIEQARLHDRNVRRLLLHDTVLTTLTAIARGGLRGQAGTVRDRCADDLEALTADTDTSEATRTAEQLLAVTQRHATHRGLQTYVTGEAATQHQLPAEVAAAFAAALREALSNIEKHADTSEVGIAVRSDANSLEMTIHDPGRGFDPAKARGGLGLSGSLTGRMTAVGGTATVESAIGRGTAVTLRWDAADADAHHAAPARASGDSAARAATVDDATRPVATAGPSAPETALSSAESVVSDRYTRYGLLALAWIGHFWQALSLALLIANWADYRSGAVALAGWAVLFVLTLVQVYLVTFQGSRGRPVDWVDRHAGWLGTLAVVAALAVLVDCTPTGLLTPANWPIGVLGWILAVFAVRQPRWLDVGWASLAVVSLGAVWIGWDGSLAALAVALGVVFGAGIPQVGALIVVFELRRTAASAATATTEAQRLAADGAARDAVTADRAQRDAALNRELIPLLRALADGTADPDDPADRRRCELAAAEVRALVDHDDLTTPIATLDAVAAVTRSARQRDIVPIVHLGDGLDIASPGWQRTFAHLAERMLAEALPGEATLTVRGDTDTIAVTLCFPTSTPAPELVSVAASASAALVPDRQVRVDIEPDMTQIAWLEVTWETRTAA